MEITIKSGSAYFKSGEEALELKGRSAAPVVRSAHALIDQIRRADPQLGQDMPPADQVAVKVIPQKIGPAKIELHYFNPGDAQPHTVRALDSNLPADSLERAALAQHKLAKRVTLLPDGKLINSQFESKPAKVLRHSRHIRTATEAVEDLISVDKTIEGAEKIAQRFKGSMRLTAGFGVASTVVSGLGAVEEFKTLQQNSGSLERRAEVITNLFAHVTRGAAYGTATTVGAIELAKGASKSTKTALKVIPVLSSIANLLEAFASAIQFHTKRVFFSEAGARIKQAEQLGGDQIERKAQAIWSYVRSRVTCEEGEIATKMAQFTELSDAEKVADLTEDFKKGLGWRFFSNASTEEKAVQFQTELFAQLDGLEDEERSNFLDLMKQESIRTRVEIAKSHDVSVITSEEVAGQLKTAVSSLNMELRHHQWAALGIYTAMESDYKSKRYVEVASIVANIGSGIIGIAAIAVPGGVIVQIISGALSATDIGSMAYLNRHTLLKMLNLSNHVDLSEHIENMIEVSKKRKVRRLY